MCSKVDLAEVHQNSFNVEKDQILLKMEVQKKGGLLNSFSVDVLLHAKLKRKFLRSDLSANEKNFDFCCVPIKLLNLKFGAYG